MARVNKSQIITAIDIGTTKICVFIAQCNQNQIIDILGIGRAPSHGLRKGIVVDVAKTVHSIKKAIEEASLMAKMPIERAYIGVAGAHIRSLNSHGMVPIEKHEVREHDVQRVLKAAEAVAIPEGQQILHVLPQFFSIDGGEKIENPRGMHGLRLESSVHIITGAIHSVQDLIKCCELAGVQVIDVVLEQLASAYAVLSDDERELGVGLLDIGGGTSDFAVYQRGSIKHTMVLPIAGNHFTHDLAIGLQTALHEAERIKCEYGNVSISELDAACISIKSIYNDELITIPQKIVAQILAPRSEEIFYFVKQELDIHRLHSYLRTGLVLTGGGSLLTGIAHCAEHILRMPVRCSIPNAFSNSEFDIHSPIYATGCGLLLYGIRKQDTAKRIHGSLGARLVDRMRSWVTDFF